MRHIQTRRPLPKKREGFTLIELLVVISIIATLVALITPAVQSAREAARRTECINNMKNIALAAKNFAGQSDGKFPSTYDTYAGTALTYNYGWPVALLPFLDASALFDRISNDGRLPNSAGGTQAAPGPGANYTPGLFLKVFTCPDDLDKDSLAGGLSYAANIGYVSSAQWGGTAIWDDPLVDDDSNVATSSALDGPSIHNQIDWDGNGSTTTANINQTRDTGVFMDPRVRAVTEDGISRNDGMSQTLMFAENLQSQNWASVRLGDIGFGYSIDTLGSTTGTLVQDSASAYTLQIASGWTAATAGGDDPRINKNLQANVGRQWRPASNHPGIVIVSFCDGRAKALDANMDGRVYFRLITSGGTKRHNQLLVGDNF